MIKINCDLCGKTTESLGNAIIEGVQLDVCNECAKFGKIIEQPKRFSAKEQAKQFQRQVQKEEKTELLVENYSDIIKRKRELMGLTQKEFAKKINEKEATIHNLEVGALAPSLSLAKKLEKALGVKLIGVHFEKDETFKRKKEESSFTLGDFIKHR